MSEQQRIAADPAISAFVTANAGSGKTKTLIDRTARLLLKEAKPQTILCVTYTKAAAAEMQRRLFDLLGGWSVMGDEELAKILTDLQGVRVDASDRQTLSEARTLFAKALETPGGLKIQTIHAFCERVLRRFPLEAGVSPGFEVIDDAAAAAIAAAARAHVAEAALSGISAELSEAYARFSVALDYMSFQAMFSAFEAERGAIDDYLKRLGGLASVIADVWAACGFTDGAVDPTVLEAHALTDLNLAVWRAASALLIDGGKDLKCAAALAAVAADPAFDGALGVMFIDKGKGPPATVFTRSALLKSRPDLQNALLADQEALELARDEVRAARVAQDTAYALTLASFYVDAYEIEKSSRGVLDFADLVRKTCELLRDAPASAWVLYKLDGGIDHILLDEAQDTAPDQWKILRGLTEEFFSGAGRPADRPAERTLFVVGDEKQSIYSFQGADPKRLAAETNAYIELIRASGRKGEVAPLEESWRSVDEVLTFVDTVFAPDGLRSAVQAAKEGPVSHRLTRHGHAGCVDLWHPEREQKEEAREAWDDPLDTVSATSANRRLADKIAGEIARLVREGDGVYGKDGGLRSAGYGDVLILVRRRGVLFEEILRALKRRDVPVAGADRLALSAHIAFDDLIALARFALYPSDELTLAALLKSPFCGLDDDSLYALAYGREKTNLWPLLAARAAERPEWTRAYAFLSGVIVQAGERRPFDFYARILGRLDGEGRSGRLKMLARLGPEAADAIDEFMAQVLSVEARGVRDLESLAAAFAGLDITVKREMDQARGEVRVMTAHGAKGLEAPIVFLPEMTLTRAARGGPLLKTEAGGFLWCAAAANDCEASAQAREARALREEEERLRLFYVALTRARDRLVLCGRIAADAKLENIGGWYGAAVEALAHDALRGKVRTLEQNGLAFARYGDDPQILARSASAARSEHPLPEWLSRPPRAEAAGVRYLSPSAIAETAKTPAVSPLEGGQGLGRYRRGTLIHRLLQLLPDVEEAARPTAAAALLAREPGLDDAQRAEIADAALGVLNDPVFAAVFGPGSRAEVAVAGAAAALPSGVAVGGRLDRLVIEPDRVLVVDFKTNRPSPERIEDADPAYLMQMAAYVAVLRQAFPDRSVEAALVWTDGPKLMPITENLLAQALAKLAVTA